MPAWPFDAACPLLLMMLDAGGPGETLCAPGETLCAHEKEPSLASQRVSAALMLSAGNPPHYFLSECLAAILLFYCCCPPVHRLIAQRQAHASSSQAWQVPSIRGPIGCTAVSQREDNERVETTREEAGRFLVARRVGRAACTSRVYCSCSSGLTVPCERPRETTIPAC